MVQRAHQHLVAEAEAEVGAEPWPSYPEVEEVPVPCAGELGHASWACLSCSCSLLAEDGVPGNAPHLEAEGAA